MLLIYHTSFKRPVMSSVIIQQFTITIFTGIPGKKITVYIGISWNVKGLDGTHTLPQMSTQTGDMFKHGMRTIYSLATNNTLKVALQQHHRRILRCWLSSKSQSGAQTCPLLYAKFWAGCVSWAMSQQMLSTLCRAQYQSAWHNVQRLTLEG